jgi:hypothetical protein
MAFRWRTIGTRKLNLQKSCGLDQPVSSRLVQIEQGIYPCEWWILAFVSSFTYEWDHPQVSPEIV